MSKRILCLAIILLTLGSHALCDQTDMPEWTYPLSPEIIADKRGFLTLTNKESLMDASFEPDDLVKITARCAVQGELRLDCNAALCRLFDAAEQEGLRLYVKSSYRSYKTQKTMYYNRLSNVGYDDGYVAYPGSSDHQTGLGVDVLNLEWTKKDGMNAAFGKTKEAQWMAENCFRYGFVIRYMEDKEAVTGIRYEPWHLRYVGPEAALFMADNHWSLEEFSQDCAAYLREWEAQGGNLEALVAQRAMPGRVIVTGYGDDGEEDISIYRGR